MTTKKKQAEPELDDVTASSADADAEQAAPSGADVPAAEASPGAADSDELEAPAESQCAVAGCPRAPVQSGLCGGHYATRRGDRVRG